MHSFAIVSDSACDIPPALTAERQITLVPFYSTFDGEHYQKEGVELSLATFYHTLRTQKVYPKTSLPSIQDYVDACKPILEQGQDILCFCLAQKFSGSYQSAVNAAAILREDFPGRKMIVMDSMQVSAGQGFIVLEAARQRDNGASLEDTVSAIEAWKESVRIIATVDSLEYLQRGGRIGKVSSLAGSILNIKPLFLVQDGELSPYGKVRGRKKAIQEMISYVLKAVGDQKDSYLYCVIHSDCPDDGNALVRELAGNYGINVALPLIDIGVTVGVHIGPTALGIAYAPKPY